MSQWSPLIQLLLTLVAQFDSHLLTLASAVILVIAATPVHLGPIVGMLQS